VRRVRNPASRTADRSESAPQTVAERQSWTGVKRREGLKHPPLQGYDSQDADEELPCCIVGSVVGPAVIGAGGLSGGRRMPAGAPGLLGAEPPRVVEIHQLEACRWPGPTLTLPVSY